MQRRNTFFSASALLLTAACTFNPKVDPSQLDCKDDNGCPSGYRCVGVAVEKSGFCCNKADEAACFPPPDAARAPTDVGVTDAPADMNSADDIFAERQALDVNATDREETRFPDSSSSGFDAATDLPADQAGTGGTGGSGNIDAPVATGGVGGIDAPVATGGAGFTDGPTAADGRDAPVATGGVDANDAPVATGGTGAGGTGGTGGSGGTAGTGGTTGTGGTIGTGGATSTGGTATGGVATGGTSTGGGTTSAGGITTAGGMTSAGGTTTTGGTIASGGTTSAGGTTTAGGTTASGGSSGSGGTNSKGGTWGGTAPSCSGLATTCGPSGTDECCKSLLVPGGTFYRSYDGVDFTDPSYPATVSDFYLDKYEITVGRFRVFVNAGMGTQASPPAAGAGAHPGISGSGWDSTWNTSLAVITPALMTALKCSATYQTWTDTAGSNESKPVNCLDWYTAFAFCAWDGGRLATEAEWNYAASGGSEQRYYPWSSPTTPTTIDASYAVYLSSAAQNVGSKSPKGDGKWGQSDLAGNVWEWTFDWYASPYQMPCNNCVNATAASYRVIRGGYFVDDASLLRSAYRGNYDPGYRDVLFDIGARCARTSL